MIATLALATPVSQLLVCILLLFCFFYIYLFICSGLCTYETVVCDDGNPCTDDYCDIVSGCQTKAKQCNDSSLCTTDTCNPSNGGLLYSLGVNYAKPFFLLSACVFTPVSCDDSVACTVDSCAAATGCNHTAIQCDDNNVCTTELCTPSTGVCAYTAGITFPPLLFVIKPPSQ